MIEELQQEIEIFKKEKIKVLRRGDAQIAELNIPSKWKVALSHHSTSVPQVIKEVWDSAPYSAQPIIKFLSKRIKDVVLITGVSTKKAAELCYVFEIFSQRFQATFTSGWVAGTPFDNSLPLSLTELAGINIPRVYREFCSIHNGLLLDGNLSTGFLPIEKLGVLDKENNRKLLEFNRDGLGNVRFFELSAQPNSIDLETLDWDHESMKSSNPMSFWDFAYSFITANTKSE
jgi:hypothetical protein